MKMVAAAKMKGTESRLMAGRVFGSRVCGAAFPQKADYTEEELDEDPSVQLVTESDKNTFLVISSDKGLCGGVNSQVSKLTRLSMERLEAEGKAGDAVISVVGDKARGPLERLYGNHLSCTMDETWRDDPNFSIASAITSRLLVEDSDRVHVVFNTFQSAIAYQPTIFSAENYHKFNDNALESGADVIYPAHLEEYEFEPENSTEALQNMYEFGLAGAVYNGMIEGEFY